MNPKLKFKTLSGTYQILKLLPSENIPAWVLVPSAGFSSITRTEDELSIVIEKSSVPLGLLQAREWACLMVLGPLDFSLTGILHSITEPLKLAKIPLFAVSTYDTDYVLVELGYLEEVKRVLLLAGHAFPLA